MLKEHEGEYLKYPQLCELIGDKPKTGRSKMLHIQRIKQYVDINQDRR